MFVLYYRLALSVRIVITTLKNVRNAYSAQKHPNISQFKVQKQRYS